jgi:DNA-directed RNA polymerase II subunit RPB1
MNPQASKTNMCVVQDSLLGAYLMTKNDEKIPKETFYNICMKGDGWTSEYILDKIQHIRRTLKELGKPILALNGKGLISLMLPNDFHYYKKTNADSSQPEVKIYKGVLYEGVLNKAVLGAVHNSILQTLYKEYDEDVCMNFINNIQFITNEWLLYHGFSIGIGDCIATKQDEIKDAVLKNFYQAKTVEFATQHPKIKEAKISACLNKAKDLGMKIAKEAMKSDNGFIATVTSGSKGDYFNIAQISGLLGQQNLTGQRVNPVLNKGKRTLPHYGFTENTIERQFESRGFIRNSFMKGLNPQEFWFHAMSGREGVSDTAMKTASSGYVQRRMIKMMEDLQVRYDGTVRNTSGSIIQWAYGEDGLDRCNTIVKNEKTEMLDISRLVQKLNIDHESKK